MLRSHFAPLILLATTLSALDGSAQATARTAPATARSTTPAAQTTTDERVHRADLARIMGSPDAKVWVIVISDFQCPFCKQWSDTTEPQLRKEFVETGKVRMAYINYPLSQHAHAMEAAEAAMCAGAQDKFWVYHDKLFATAGEWIPTRNPAAIFERLARDAGVELGAYRKCVAEHVMEPLIRADYERSIKSGARSTPTFLVSNMSLAGAQKIDVFRMAIAQALKGGMK